MKYKLNVSYDKSPDVNNTYPAIIQAMDKHAYFTTNRSLTSMRTAFNSGSDGVPGTDRCVSWRDLDKGLLTLKLTTKFRHP